MDLCANSWSQQNDIKSNIMILLRLDKIERKLNFHLNNRKKVIGGGGEDEEA